MFSSRNWNNEPVDLDTHQMPEGPSPRVSEKAALALLSILSIPGLAGRALAAEPVMMPLEPTPIVSTFTGVVLEGQYAKVQSTDDLISNWHKDVNLYVKGDVKINDAQLKELANWLRAEHPNWTVFLNEKCAAERYTDPEGRKFSGYQAVEHLLRDKLPNNTGYGSLRGTESGERNGAVFYLTFDGDGVNRKAGFYASEEYNNRGYYNDDKRGESRANARILDQITIPTLQKQDPINAIKDSIGAIDRDVASQIRNARLEHERTIAGAKDAVTGVEASLTLLQSKVAKLQEQYPNASGDLVRPNFTPFNDQIRRAAQALSAEDYAGAASVAGSTKSEIDTLVRDVDAYPKAVQTLKSLAEKLEELKKHDYYSDGANEHAAAEAAVKHAEESWERGERSYSGALNHASQSVGSAEDAMDSAETSAAAAKAFKVGGSSLLGLGALVAGVVTLRRRQIAKAKAEKLFEEAKEEVEELYGRWDQVFKEKGSSILALDSQLIDLKKRRSGVLEFDGKTAELMDKTSKALGELSVRYQVGSDVIKRAGDQISAAKSPDTSSLEQANETLTTPVTFERGSDIELSVNGKRIEHENITKTFKEIKPFSMSLEELDQQLAQFGKVAVEGLGKILEAEKTVHGKIGEQTTQLTEIENAVKELESKAMFDRIFAFGSISESFLPTLRNRISAAKKDAVKDPVDSSEILYESGEAISSVEALIATVTEARSGSNPEISILKIQEGEAALDYNGVKAVWIGERLGALSGEVDLYCARVTKEKSELPKVDVEAQLKKIGTDVKVAIALDQERCGKVATRLNDVKELIGKTRTEIGLKLGISADDLLVEKDNNPDEFLAKAREVHEQAKEFLSKGDLLKAREALEEVIAIASDAEKIVKESAKAFENYEKTLTDRRAEEERIKKSLPAYTSVLERLVADYHPTALLLGAGDPTHPKANGTVTDNLDEANEGINGGTAAITKAVSLQKQGRLLEAAFEIERAQEWQKMAQHRLDEITEKAQRIADTIERNNRSVGGLAASLESVTAEMQDKRMTKETLAQFLTLSKNVTSARTLFSSPKNNPMQVEQMIVAATAGFATIARRIEADREIYAEVKRSIEHFETSLGQAQQADVETQNDQVEDSTEILNARRKVSELAREVELLRRDFAVSNGDWHALDQRADKLAEEANRARATLRKELEEAEKAVEMSNSAYRQMQSARGWSGSYGVSVSGNPGADAYNEARRFLQLGQYALAYNHFSNAQRSAEAAIDRAEAEVARRRRAEEERQEEERREAARRAAARRAEESRRSSSWSSSSSSSFSSRSFSSGGSSGFSSRSW